MPPTHRAIQYKKQNTLPLPNFSGSPTASPIGNSSKEARDYALAVRRDAQKLLNAGNPKEAIALIDKIISPVESLLTDKTSTQPYPYLKAFWIHLQEIKCRIVNQFPLEKKTQELIDKSITTIKDAYEQSKKVLGIMNYNRIEILIQWMHLITATVCNEDIIDDSLKNTQYVSDEFRLLEIEEEKKDESNKYSLITQGTGFRIAINKAYWEMGKKQRSLYCWVRGKEDISSWS